MRHVYMESALRPEDCARQILESGALKPLLGGHPPYTRTTEGGMTVLNVRWHGGDRLTAKLKLEQGRTMLGVHYHAGPLLWIMIVGLTVVNPAVFALVGSVIPEPILQGISNWALFGGVGLAMAACELPMFWCFLSMGEKRLFRKIAAAAQAEQVSDPGRPDL